MNNAQSITPGSRRLLIWSLLGLMLLTALGGFIVALPAIAPQLVIAHSPWIWPVLRAEAYETEGKEPDLNVNPHPIERYNLVDRLFNEENWEQAAVPVLTRALDHPDLRLRRTAAKTMSELLAAHPDSRFTLTPKITQALLQTMDDPDDELASRSFCLLCDSEDPAVAQVLLEHAPRQWGLSRQPRSKSLYAEFPWAWYRDPHALKNFHRAQVYEQVQDWLADKDEDLVRLGCMLLAYSDDPRAIAVFDAHLGRHICHDELSGWQRDFVACGLGCSITPQALDLIHRALADPVIERRHSAVVACQYRGSSESLPHLHALIDDPDPDVRNTLAACLAGYPLEHTLPDLCRIIARGGKPAVTAVDRIRSNRMFLHRSRPWWGRGDVVPAVDPDRPGNWALEGRIIAEFSAFTTHPEPAVRFSLARYLCSTWEQDTERVLRSMADDPDPQVRAEIAAELEAITKRIRRDPATYRSYQTPTADTSTAP